MNKKTIEYYRKSVYGRELEYIVDAGDAGIISQLISSKTVTAAQRELFRDLTGGQIQWVEVVAPK
jgi:hypothetical protein